MVHGKSPNKGVHPNVSISFNTLKLKTKTYISQ